MLKEDILQIEDTYKIKIPGYAKFWLKKSWGRLQTSKRIPVTSRGYNKALQFLLLNDIVSVDGIFPFNGYGESFRFTKSLFKERKKFTIEHFSEVLSQMKINTR